jgi:transcriptional antiterminator
MSQEDISMFMRKYPNKYFTILELSLFLHLSDSTINRQIIKMNNWKELAVRPRIRRAQNGASRITKEYRLIEV